MCYSAQITASYKKYTLEYGARLSIHEFFDLFWARRGDPGIQIPRGVEAAFDDPQSDQERAINSAVVEWRQAQKSRFAEEIALQQARLDEADRKLSTKVTKAAQESKRIASKKISWAQAKIADLERTSRQPEDARIFPGSYVPVMVMENGERVIKPMRYQCRLPGKPAYYDIRFPGTYNARLDRLEEYWRPLFGHTHGIVIFESFYEFVSRHRLEGRALQPGEREQKVMLEFKPDPAQDLLVACLWSRWKGGPNVPDLLSFAVITDEPPPEIRAAGHDRCVVPLKPAHIDAWLNPDPLDLQAQYAILQDRVRPFFAHDAVEDAGQSRNPAMTQGQLHQTVSGRD